MDIGSGLWSCPRRADLLSCWLDPGTAEGSNAGWLLAPPLVQGFRTGSVLLEPRLSRGLQLLGRTDKLDHLRDQITLS